MSKVTADEFGWLREELRTRNITVWTFHLGTSMNYEYFSRLLRGTATAGRFARLMLRQQCDKHGIEMPHAA